MEVLCWELRKQEKNMENQIDLVDWSHWVMMTRWPRKQDRSMFVLVAGARDLRKYTLLQVQCGSCLFSWIYSTCSVYMTNWNSWWIGSHLLVLTVCLFYSPKLLFLYNSNVGLFFLKFKLTNYSYCGKYLWNDFSTDTYEFVIVNHKISSTVNIFGVRHHN